MASVSEALEKQVACRELVPRRGAGGSPPGRKDSGGQPPFVALGCDGAVTRTQQPPQAAQPRGTGRGSAQNLSRSRSRDKGIRLLGFCAAFPGCDVCVGIHRDHGETPTPGTLR